MFIAVDDTDSRRGMCTTFLATELIREFKDYQLLDHPRLVRLNPNVPWKTRGNGSICIEIGPGGSEGETAASIQGQVKVYDDGGGCSLDKEEILLRAEEIVEEWSEFDENANPGIVVSYQRPPRNVYERAVTDVVDLGNVLDMVKENDMAYKGYGNRRGLIGALSAMAWIPKDHTYELIAYREEERWGSERRISESDVKHLDEELPNTYDNYDHENHDQVIAPRSPCPVLYGVRGDDRNELLEALDMIESEPVDRWAIFLTNQGTDDHLQEKKIEEVDHWTSCILRGKVISKPKVIEGGHVFFDLDDGTGKMTVGAYEPTKDFRKVVKKLIPGDEVKVYGGVRKDPLTLNLEKIEVIELAEKIIKVGNPRCPECGKRMSSIGKDAGFRCKRCSTKAGEDDIETEDVERELVEGWYEPPPSARRHLSKPLKRVEG